MLEDCLVAEDPKRKKIREKERRDGELGRNSFPKDLRTRLVSACLPSVLRLSGSVHQGRGKQSTIHGTGLFNMANDAGGGPANLLTLLLLSPNNKLEVILNALITRLSGGEF